MPINARLEMFDKDYVEVLEGCRLLANSLVAELNALGTSDGATFSNSLTTHHELEQYLLAHPITTNPQQPADIDITLFNTNALSRNSLAYVEDGKLTTRKIPLAEIVCANTYPSDGYVVAVNSVGSKVGTVPAATTTLQNDNLVCVKNGNVIAFPADPDPDIQRLFLGVNNIHVGTSAYFGNPDMIPAGWLLEDGREVLKSQYPKLYAAIGDRYGAPSNSTVFRIPDKRGLFIIGHDPSDVLRVSKYPGGVSGASVGSMSNYFTNNTVPSHTHSSVSAFNVVDYSKIYTVYRFLEGLTIAYEFVYNTNVGQSSTPDTYDPATGVKTSNEYRPKNISLVSIIRALP